MNITNATVANGTFISGGGTNIINLNGGTLIVTNTAGGPTSPITTLSLTGGTLQLSVNGSSLMTNIGDHGGHQRHG